MSRILRIIIILILLIAGGYGIWWQLSRNKEKMEEQVALATERVSFVPVEVAEAGPFSLEETFSVNGAFEPSKELVVVSTVNGEIIESHIRPGQYVRKGDLMLVVDHTYTQNELAATRLNLARAEKDVERMSNLIGEGGVTQAQFEDAQVKLESAKIQVQSLEKRLKDSFIKAPISGTVTLLPRTQEPILGAYLGQGKPICQLVNVERMRLQVQLTEEQIVKVKEGMEVKLSADVYPGPEFSGKVRLVGIKAEIMSKRFPVEIELSNSRKYPLKGGMNGKAHFELGRQTAALVVPRQAFAGSLQEGKVYLVEKDRASLRQVKTGKVFGDHVEILSGLSEGDRVVVSGLVNVEDGARVKVIK